MLSKKKISNTIILIIISLILSIAISAYNLSKYDKNVTKDGFKYHQMIKADPKLYVSHGAEIKKELQEGKSYFETGREGFTKYLPGRIAAAYYIIFDVDLFNNFEEQKINTGIHLPYLIIQCLFYFFSLFLLYKTISNIFNKKVCFYIILFLAIEPTLFQYHGTFWSESYFFSLQIILLSLILKEHPSNKNFFLIGIFLAILSLQKQMAIFYIIPIIFWFFFNLKESKYKKLFTVLIGYFFIQLFVGYHNLERSGKFYIMTADSKLDLFRDLVGPVMAEKNKTSRSEFFISESRSTSKWINKTDIEYDKIKVESINNPTLWNYRSSIYKEKDKVKFDNYVGKRTLYYFIKYPKNFIIFVTNKTIHSALLNPFHIYSDHNFRSGEHYYTTKTHDRLVPYRIAYTLIIYFFCLVGLITMFKQKNYKILFLLFLSILYFYGLVSWHGNTRYYVPVLIYLSILFGFGCNNIIHEKLKT